MTLLRTDVADGARNSSFSRISVKQMGRSFAMAPCQTICQPYSVPGGGTPCGSKCMMYCVGK